MSPDRPPSSNENGLILKNEKLSIVTGNSNNNLNNLNNNQMIYVDSTNIILQHQSTTVPATTSTLSTSSSLSSIPINGIVNNSTNLNIVNGANLHGINVNMTSSSSSSTTASKSISATSKIVVVQQQATAATTAAIQAHHLNDSGNYITGAATSSSIAAGATDINNNNNGGNIVLVATEQTICTDRHNSSNGTDEELTPLTWLHDKNLLKDINLSCAKVQSCSESPTHHQSSSGILTPTSDFVDDSCVSEDNTSSVNSNSDQGIAIYTTDNTTNNYQTQQINQYNNNSSNNTTNLNKNRNHIITTISPNNNNNNINSVVVGGGGQTHVVEYINGAATNCNVTINNRINNNNRSNNYRNNNNNNNINGNNHAVPLVSPSASSTSSSTSSSSSISSSSAIASPTNNNILSPSSCSSSTSSLSSTPHQHFHKKYLREEHMKNLKQGVGNCLNSMTSANRKQNQQEYNSPNKYDNDNYLMSSEKDYPSTPIRNGFKSSSGNATTVISGGTMTSSVTSAGNECAIDYETNSHRAIAQKPAVAKARHPAAQPYDKSNKPPLSFSSLIFMAIEDSAEKALPVKEIYAYILQRFPYFKSAPTGWKNSVRHNLSLNKCFQKVEKAPNMGKGSLWRVEQQYRPNLLHSLTRSPYHPCGVSSDKTIFNSKNNSRTNTVDGLSPNLLKNTKLDPMLFPHLTKVMAQIHNGSTTSNSSNYDPPSRASTPPDDDYHDAINSPPYINCNSFNNNNNNNTNINNNNNNNTNMINSNISSPERIAKHWGFDNIEDVNAATAMLALKHGPKIFNETFHNGRPPVITSSPSEDHTYSAGGGGGSRSNSSDNVSNGTSSDAAYESSEESHHITERELEEQRRHAEGVDALLNLAGVILKRPSESSSPFTENTSYHNGFHNIENRVIDVVETTVTTLHNNNSHYNNHHLSTPSPPKRSKTRTLRTKLKKKVGLR